MHQFFCRLFLAAALLSNMFSSSGYATAPDRVITVGPGPVVPGVHYNKIQDAIDLFQGTNALYTEIQIAPGTYVETIQLEQTSASSNLETRNYDLNEQLPTNTLFQGLQIIGDNRPCFPQYQNGYQHAANSNQTTVYTLETSVPGIGPYQVLVSQAFGTQPLTNTGPLSVTKCNPFIANPLPLNGPFNGNLVVIGRGTIGFATKTKRAQDAGAGAVLIVDNQPVGTVALGGTDPTITIPAFSISKIQGDALLAALVLNPAMTVTILPPATFYNPPIGTNFAQVSLSHPGGNLNQIQVTMSNPLPIVDPNLPRGTAPVLEQPLFEDPRLAFGPGDQIIISESDIFGSGGRQVFEIASLNGNIITLTDMVDPSFVDITKLGSSLTFLPNVLLVPAEGKKPVFTAQQIGFSMSGIWIDSNPSIPFGATAYGVVLVGVDANLSNIIVTDTNGTTANGNGFALFGGSTVSILDGWHDSAANRRLSVIGWSTGIVLEEMSKISGPLTFVTNLTNGTAFNVANNSFASIDTLVLMGNPGLLQPGARGLSVTGNSILNCENLLTVTDVFGGGIFVDVSEVFCPSFTLERIYKPSGGTILPNALSLVGDSLFQVFSPDLYADDGSPTALINTFSVVQDCFDIDPNGDFSSGTIPNVGIYARDQALFYSQKDLIFNNNSLDYLTAQDNQFITPARPQSPGNTLEVTQNGALNSVYQLQNLVGNNMHLTLNPSAEFQYQGLYINSDNSGKSFTIFSKNATRHTITLSSGSFVGTDLKTLEFCPIAGSFVTLKILSPSEVLVEDSRGVEFLGLGKCDADPCVICKCKKCKCKKHHKKHKKHHCDKKKHHSHSSQRS